MRHLEVKPKEITHRGVIEVAGLIFDTSLLGENRARARVLSIWHPSDIVYRTQSRALVLKLSKPVWMDCSRAPGGPLTSDGYALFAAPLTDDEVEQLDCAEACLVFVSGGNASVEPLTEIELPERWLDVDAFDLIQVQSLGPLPPRPRAAVDALDFNARERLPGVPPAAPELKDFLNSLGEDKTSDPSAKDGPGLLRWFSLLWRHLRRMGGSLGTEPGQTPDLQAPAASRLVTFFGRLRRILGGIKSEQGTGLSSKKLRLSSAAKPPEAGLLIKFRLIVKRTLAIVLRETQLARLLGRRQAQYLGDLINRIESGDIGEALKRAIPLGGKFEEKLNSPMLGVPGVRNDLSISPYTRLAGSSLGIGNDTFSYLRRLYRSMFERLSAQSRIDEAAFVLAELLLANEEAVNFLERNGRLQLAAEIAEARELTPGIVVRQWFLAGNKERAIRIARRTGAYQDAILRLERSDKDKANELRVIWAETLAQAGDYLVAAETCLSVQSARPRFINWLHKAVDVGGTQGARALAYLAAELPEAFEAVRSKALNLLEDESTEGLPARFAFIETLRRASPSLEAKALGRAAIRAAVRDSTSALGKLPPARLRLLTDFAADRGLRADVPATPAYKSIWSESFDAPLRFQFEPTDAGVSKIEDLVYLPNGNLAVALGESGLALLNRQGKTVARFDHPAYKLVPSDSGNKAIVMAPRGDIWRLARVDFLSKSIEPWTDARIDCFADSHDGSVWFIAAEGDFYSIDATSARFESLWRIPDIGEGIAATTCIARTATSCAILTTNSLGCSLWQYQVPSMRLRNKGIAQLLPTDLAVACYGVSGDGTLAEIHISVTRDSSPLDQDPPSLDLPGQMLRITFANGTRIQFSSSIGNLDALNTSPPLLSGDWVLTCGAYEQGRRACLFNIHRTVPAMEMALVGTSAPVIRLQDGVACIADERGRVFVLDLASGSVLRNLRI